MGNLRKVFNPKEAQAGFTLLELLVSLMLMGMLSIAMFGSLHFGTAVWTRSQQETIGLGKAAVLATILSDMIGRAYPLVVSSDSKPYVDFDGQPSSLSFLVSPEGQSGSMTKVTLSVGPIGKGLGLVQDQHPELAIGTKGGTRKTLLADVQAVRFSYFGFQPGDPKPEWRPDWHDRMTLPSMVKIRLTFLDTKDRLWPDLIVRTRIFAGADCVFDSLSKSCQGRS